MKRKGKEIRINENLLPYNSNPGASSSSEKDAIELSSSDELSSVAASAASFVAYLFT